MDNSTANACDQELSLNSFLAPSDDRNAGLDFWLARDAEISTHRKKFRRHEHEFEAGLISRPATPEKAYGQLGLLLGIFPPVTIFSRMFLGLIHPANDSALFVFVPLFVIMTLICGFVGFGMGRLLAQTALSAERSSWSKMVFTIPLVGLLWGMVTGFLGGLFFFGLGAIAGLLVAAPIGAVAFTVFAIFHRLLERGTLIDRRHLLPLTFGISLTIAGSILGL